MKKIILDILNEICCSNTNTCQINMQSESAREMIADKISQGLEPYVNEKMGNLIEDVICGDSCHGNK